MLPAVHLDDESPLTADESADEWSNSPLPGELEPTQLPVAQMSPQASLSFGRIVPQMLGTLCLARAELRHDSVMPTVGGSGKSCPRLIHSRGSVRAHPFGASGPHESNSFVGTLSRLFPSRKR
jgi:hypothetical protein